MGNEFFSPFYVGPMNKARTNEAPDKAKLTERQEEVLEMIRQFRIDNDFPPTRAEIARAFGFQSANAAEDYLRALERKGYVRLVKGISRGIVLL